LKNCGEVEMTTSAFGRKREAMTAEHIYEM